jgi:hypothetical protein
VNWPQGGDRAMDLQFRCPADVPGIDPAQPTLMRPNISEFSYGYALTSELVEFLGYKGVGAPVFPSLKDEGTLGYDVKLPGVIPVFLQFKLCDRMVSGAANEADLLGVPHFRMHLRPLRHSDQHDLLIALEAQGNAVFYACPEFTEPDELNDAYDKKQVLARSMLLSPSAIGSLDGGDHHVAFLPGAPVAYVCSEPRIAEREAGREALAHAVAARSSAARVPTREYFVELTKELLSIYAVERPQAVDLNFSEGVVPRDPRDTAALLAHSLFGCALLFAPVEGA